MHVYLSPHHDDACFSLGHLASRQGGEVVNIFTRSKYLAANLPLPSDAEERIEMISAIRRQEDLAFIRAAGLNRHDLKLEEPGLVGYEPFELNDLEAAVARTSDRLIPFLLDLLPSDGDPKTVNLYCPMGIGGHRDHLSTLLTVRGAYDQLRSRCTVHLYEDLHYASVSPAREAGLKRAAEIFAGADLSSTVHFMSANEAARKMLLIGLYASQHPEPLQPAKFTPASHLTPPLVGAARARCRASTWIHRVRSDGPALHEIVWHVVAGS
jgi:hypothetical protein